jgi:hypothetical protein
LADLKKSLPLEPFGQMNRNLVGCIYGGPLKRLLISSLSINKYGSHRQVLFLIERKIFRNRPIRNKNCLWRPCLLMDRDEMSNRYRGPPIDTSYKV